jgi:hypothetical protein
MLAIIDYRTPAEAIDKLASYADEILLFNSFDITYNSISGHPDIFIFKDPDNLIIAPNSPEQLFQFLNKHKIKYILGNKGIGKELRSSVLYNCLCTDEYLFHKSGFTDDAILRLNSKKRFVPVPQAYTRCSLTHITDDNYITSDRGIERALKNNGLNCFYFSADQINIVTHKNGFFGGTNGMYDNKIFFTGNIDLHKNGIDLRKHLESFDIEIICLTNNFLYDGGGIFFL